MSDYGTAWRILRVSSLTDQIYIKANRIRSIQIKSTKMVDEDIENEVTHVEHSVGGDKQRTMRHIREND